MRAIIALTLLLGCAPNCQPTHSYCPNECIMEPLSEEGCSTDSECEGLIAPVEWEPTEEGMWC